MNLHPTFTSRNVFFVLFLFFTLNLSAQENYKYGKVSVEELRMQTYANDSSANAVVLYEEGITYYGFVRDFEVITEVRNRTKILKQEGVSEGTVTIPYKL